MINILLNSIALEPNRWTEDKIPYYKLDQILVPIANAGFNSIELWQYHVSLEGEKKINEYKLLADSLAVSFPVIGIYPNLHFRGAAKTRELDQIKRLLDYGDIFGAHLFKIFVGSISSAEISNLEYGYSREFINEFLDLAKEHEAVIAGETHEATLFDSPASCIKFLADVNSPHFKICFQPFDLADTTRALADYETLSEQVVHVHYQGRRHGEFELLENSDLDYSLLTRYLIDKGYSGDICIEFVKDCVVNQPQEFQPDLVLRNAEHDRDLIQWELENAKIDTP